MKVKCECGYNTPFDYSLVHQGDTFGCFRCDRRYVRTGRKICEVVGGETGDSVPLLNCDKKA